MERRDIFLKILSYHFFYSFCLTLNKLKAVYFQLNGDQLISALSTELGRSLLQEEMDLVNFPRVCADCGKGGAVQVNYILYQYTEELSRLTIFYINILRAA